MRMKIFGFSFPFILALLLFWGVHPGWTTILTFDDLPGSSVPIPASYGGLTWSDQFYQLDGSDVWLMGTGYDHGRVSDNHVAYNSHQSNVSVSSDEPFTFNGAYLTGAWNDGLNIQIQGYLGASLLYDQTVVVNPTGPTWFAFNYMGIDHLTFHSFGGTKNPNIPVAGGGTHFVMDNFTFNETTGVPEAATLLFLGAGFLGLAGVRRKLGN